MTNWDNEIDDVARAMTEGAPESALRARVMARIDRQGPRWPSMWIVSPIAVAAVLLIGVMLVRLRPVPTTVTPQPNATDVQLKPEASVARVTSNQPKPAAGSAREVVAASRGPVRMTMAASVARQDDMDSLSLAPLDIEPLGVRSMDGMESIQVARLVVPPLELPAIGEE